MASRALHLGSGIPFLVNGCSSTSPQADPFQQQLARMETQRIEAQRDYERQRAAREESFQKLLARIKQLPLDQQEVELNKLQKELEQEGREMREEEALDAQRDLAESIRELSEELEQRRY